jgi:hypothetical protein
MTDTALLVPLSSPSDNLDSRVLAFIVYQATPRDPTGIDWRCPAYGRAGLLAAWIPAQRARRVE